MADPLAADIIFEAMKGSYVVPVCLSCGKIHCDVRRTVCECDGFIPLVHSNVEGAQAAVDREAVRLAQDPAYRTQVRMRMGLPEKASYKVGNIPVDPTKKPDA